MGALIEDLLELSRVGRAAIHRDRVDLSSIANAVVEELRGKDPERKTPYAYRSACSPTPTPG